MHIIFGNYGDNTITLMQWVYHQQLTDVTVINIDTGWAALKWQERVEAGQQLAARYSFKAVTLKPPRSFSELILDRQEFPTQKYQWCPTFLKAIPLLQWLDDNDPSCVAIILLGSSRCDSRARANLPAAQESNEFYGDRCVKYPLYQMTKNEKQGLINETGLPILNHRSLECHPCIHSSLDELTNLNINEIAKIARLEQKISQAMFQGRYPHNDINTLLQTANLVQTQAENTSLEQFDLGCGSRYVCGE